MKKRQLKEQFYTFLDFNYHTQRIYLIWKTNPQLLSNLEKITTNESNLSEKYLVQLLINQIKNNIDNKLPKLHISAYLDDTCYWLGVKTHQKVRNYDYTWLDCFQIARIIVNQSDSLVNTYQSERSSFKTYAKLKLETHLLEVLHFNHEIEKYSPLGLLRKISKKKLQESLLNQGILPENFNKYLLALNILKLFYQPQKANGSKSLSWLKENELIFLVKKYNQKSNQSPIKPKDLESILLFCVDAIRSYAKPKFTSVEELTQDLPDELIADDLWETESNLSQWQEIKSILITEYSQFKEDVKMIFDLIFGLNYSQTDVAKFLDYKPYKVSRLVSRHKEKLLQQVAKQLNVNLTKQQLKEKAESLDDWLDWYCKSKYQQILKQELISLIAENLSLLKSYIINEGNQQTIAKSLAKEELEVEQNLNNIYQQLKTSIILNCNLPSDSKLVDDKLTNLVQQWLVNAPIAILETLISNGSNNDSAEVEI